MKIFYFIFISFYYSYIAVLTRYFNSVLLMYAYLNTKVLYILLYTCRHIRAMIILAMNVCFMVIFMVKCDLICFRDTEAFKLTEACFLCILLLKRQFFGRALGPGQSNTQQPCKNWTQAEKTTHNIKPIQRGPAAQQQSWAFLSCELNLGLLSARKQDGEI